MSNRAIITAMRRWQGPLLVAFSCGVGVVVLVQMVGTASIQDWLAGGSPWQSGLAGGVVLFIAVTNLIGAFVIYRLVREKQQTKAAVDNMSQGLAMFDSTGRLVLFNARYAEMYSLSAQWLKSRPMLSELLEQRLRIGKFKGDPKARMDALVAQMREGKANKEVREVGEGRVYSVANWPALGGGWVSTHDDITEQRQEGIERDRLAEQERRRVALDLAIAQFRTRVEGMLATVGESAMSLRSTAEALFEGADQAAQRAKGAVENSNSASTSVDVAASAAEELSSSITGISRQLAQTNSLVELATGEADTTNGEVANLAQAAEKIGAVVRLIQDVAGQTNLLALNATIEAARAGAAGRGFAVVASEVKSLAVQTARSTEDIAGQIAGVQASTRAAVGEISQNVASAARGTKEVVSVLADVAGAATETRGSAQTVLACSEAVATAAGDLRTE